MAADVIGQRGGGGFTVTAGNGYHPVVADIPVSKLDLADHGYPFALICFMTSAFSGMPGLFMISSAPGPFPSCVPLRKECHARIVPYGKVSFTGVLSLTNMS